MYELTKDLEIKTSIVSNLVFPKNAIWSCFFFFLIIDIYFLILAAIAQIFNATTELAIRTGAQADEANTKIETQPVPADTKISKSST